MKKYMLALAAGAALVSSAAKNDDPVLMNVAGKDVHLSEFEYLYNKNNAQQVQPQTLDEYVNMFVDYKLKVADAEAAGIDTTATFRAELAQFSNDLSAPYLRDTAMEDSLLNLAYSHLGEDVTVSHIMLPLSKKPGQPGPDPAVLADSLLTELREGTGKFEKFAERFSVDKRSAARGGYMGVVVPGAYPWAFEEAAYNTPVGGFSDVINSGFGLHIIRVEKRQPTRGQVLAEHILRLTRNMSPEQAKEQELRIDSIYNVVTSAGADFNEVAGRLSEDTHSAKKGGKLDWFGSGVMVAEFDSVAFALPVGAISKPFKTAYGWHIIHKLDQRGMPTLDEARADLVQAMTKDGRAAMPRRRFLDKLKAKNDVKIDRDAISGVVKKAVRINHTDSVYVASLSKDATPLAVVNGTPITVAEAVSELTPQALTSSQQFANGLPAAVDMLVDERLADIARADLAANNADYRNLLNEYRDGILLFDISRRNVWDRAANDTTGLEEYFAANRDKYSWDSPRFRSFVIFANSDSILGEAMTYGATLPADITMADLTTSMRTKFGREVKVEEVIAAKGDNPITDYLGFGAEKPSSDGKRWSHYAAFRPMMLNAPRTAADVRGKVVTDYQGQLEKDWIGSLHKKYPVKINSKVLKKVKK